MTEERFLRSEKELFVGVCFSTANLEGMKKQERKAGIVLLPAIK